MPRWIPLLALCTLALVGSVAHGWAPALGTAEVHQTALLDSEPPGEGDEAAVGSDPEAGGGAEALSDRAVAGNSPPDGSSVPPVPPPQ